MNKKIILILIVVLISLICITFAVYFYLTSNKTVKSLSKPIRVARSYWPGEDWVEIANQKGWFRDEGLNIELIDANPDYYGSLEDTVNGKIDINNFDVYDLISFNLKNSKLVMIINLDTSYGGEAIIARSGINSTLDLRGKKIGLKTESYTEYILEAVLDRDGLKKEDITLIDIQDEKLLEKFRNGSIDAFITWSPITDDAIKEGGHKIFDTSELLGISSGGHAIRKDFLINRSEDLQKFVNVWYKTTKFIKENQSEAFNIIAINNNVSVEDVRLLAEKDKILNLDDNIISFTYAQGLESLYGASKKINNFMIQKNLTEKQLDSSVLFDSRFIRKLRSDNQ